MTAIKTSALLLCVFGAFDVQARRPLSPAGQCGDIHVSITVSPIVRSKEARILEVSWDYPGAQIGDVLALYDYNPVEKPLTGDNKREFEVSTVPYSNNSPTERNYNSDPTSTTNSRFGSDSDSRRDQYGGDTGYRPGPDPHANGYRPPGADPYGSGYRPAPDPYANGYRPAPDPYANGYRPAPDPYANGYRPGPDPYANGYRPSGPDPYGNSYRPNNPLGVGPQDYNNAPPRNYQPFPVGYPRDYRGRSKREATSGRKIAEIQIDGLRRGWRSSQVQEKHESSYVLGYSPRCLDYYVTYERRPPMANDTEILAVSCLRTRPTWMESLRSKIGHLRLIDLLIPGTHDSAAYREVPKTNILDRYSVTQDESVLGQLIYGARYIDLRVGFYKGKNEEWWANHGPIKMHPLSVIFGEIKTFLRNTNEIVILDVQEFPSGFGKDHTIHMKLLHEIEKELGDLMAPRDLTWSASLEDVWQGQRRLIVAYDKEEILQYSRKLWVSVRQFWADAQTPSKLNEYASRIMERPPFGFPWALMTELTPNARLIASNPTGSLRRLAEQVNHNVTSWVRGPWGKEMNVIAVDFLRSTEIVDAAMEQNLRRARVQECEVQRLVYEI